MNDFIGIIILSLQFENAQNSNLFCWIEDLLGKSQIPEGNSNSNLLILKVIVIVIYYNDFGSNSNSNILIFKVIVIVIYYIAM